MKRITTSLFLLVCMMSKAQMITVNQLGYFPDQVKYAIVHDIKAKKFQLVDAKSHIVKFTGKLSDPELWGPSGQKVRIADFSKFTGVGEYYIRIDQTTRSHHFSIGNDIYMDLARESLRFFYLSRVSMPLEEKYAGKFARAAGHPDTSVIIHETAASEKRPAGSGISTPGGWYDAGDYNKYVVNSGITTYSLLSIAEHFPDFASRLSLNIPESGNQVPDVINETVYNIRWMLSMQDPNDGGVYHKCTHSNFVGILTPAASASEPRYVVMKTTSAALNLSAVAAQACRLLKKYEEVYPGLADSCLKTALYAYEWAKEHPEVYFTQPAGMNTGTYADRNLADEFSWAAIELFITTGEGKYLTESGYQNINPDVPDWRNVSSPGLISLLRNREKVSTVVDMTAVEGKLLRLADSVYYNYQKSAYRVPVFAFYWGSNGGVANNALIALQAYHISKNEKYMELVITALDYLLGRNPTGYCFVTGFGSKSPMNPHDRKSASDEIAEPLPGMLVGGPDPDHTRDCGPERYPSKFPALSYLDELCSYSTNEVAINWNAALAYIVCAVEALEIK